MVADYLEEIALLLSKERPLQPIPESEGGYEDISVDYRAVQKLTVPAEAVSALIVLEADENTRRPSTAIRYKFNGTPPTRTKGLSKGHMDTEHFVGFDTLNALGFISVEANRTHWVRVQYFRTTQKVSVP